MVLPSDNWGSHPNRGSTMKTTTTLTLALSLLLTLALPLTLADEPEDEYEYQDQYDQQQVLIEVLQQEALDDAEEIAQLRDEVDRALEEQEDRMEREEARRSALQALYDRRVAQEEDVSED